MRTGNESWFPWIDVAPDGTVGLLYHDRRPGNTYVAELAEGSPGAFATTVVSQALSHPDESAFFQAGIPEREECATLYGDYLGLDYGANMVWTDMRDTSPAYDGYQQFALSPIRPTGSRARCLRSAGRIGGGRGGVGGTPAYDTPPAGSTSTR